MASQLDGIIAAVAALSVTVPASIAYAGNKTPQVLYSSTLVNQLPDAKLPARLIGLFRDTDPAAQSISVEFGNDNIMRVSWRIYDTLYWRSLSQGQGLGSHEADLKKYLTAYVDAMQTLPVTLSGLRSQLTGMTMAMTELAFPRGSDYYYACVEVALDIQERLVSTNPSNWS